MGARRGKKTREEITPERESIDTGRYNEKEGADERGERERQERI